MLSFLSDFVLGLFATLLEGNNASAFQVSDRSVIEVVKSGARKNQFSAQTTDQTNAWVVKKIDGDDGLKALDEWNNVFLVADAV